MELTETTDYTRAMLYGSMVVKQQIARNHKTPEHILRNAVNFQYGYSPKLVSTALRNPNLDPDFLHSIAQRETYLRWYGDILKNPRTHPRTLAMLATKYTEYVQGIITHPNVSARTVLALVAQYPSRYCKQHNKRWINHQCSCARFVDEVLAKTYENPDDEQEVQTAIYKQGSAEYRHALANSPKATNKTLAWYFYDDKGEQVPPHRRADAKLALPQLMRDLPAEAVRW